MRMRWPADEPVECVIRTDFGQAIRKPRQKQYHKRCLHCDHGFTTTCKAAKWCSGRCANDAYIERRRSRRQMARRKACPVCRKTFVGRRRDSRYCSAACRQAAYRDRCRLGTDRAQPGPVTG
jgi:hypothetical protein